MIRDSASIEPSRHGAAPSPSVLRPARGWRSAAPALLPAASLALLAGCVNLDALRERRYEEVTVEQIEAAAARRGDAAVMRGLVGIIERRLDDPAAVDVELGIEAALSLMQAGWAPAAPALDRCALEDPAEDLRYVALEALSRLAPGASRETLAIAAECDGSDIVRDHARELLDREGETAGR